MRGLGNDRERSWIITETWVFSSIVHRVSCCLFCDCWHWGSLQFYLPDLLLRGRSWNHQMHVVRGAFSGAMTQPKQIYVKHFWHLGNRFRGKVSAYIKVVSIELNKFNANNQDLKKLLVGINFILFCLILLKNKPGEMNSNVFFHLVTWQELSKSS